MLLVEQNRTHLPDLIEEHLSARNCGHFRCSVSDMGVLSWFVDLVIKSMAANERNQMDSKESKKTETTPFHLIMACSPLRNSILAASSCTPGLCLGEKMRVVAQQMVKYGRIWWFQSFGSSS